MNKHDIKTLEKYLEEMKSNDLITLQDFITTFLNDNLVELDIDGLNDKALNKIKEWIKVRGK